MGWLSSIVSEELCFRESCIVHSVSITWHVCVASHPAFLSAFIQYSFRDVYLPLPKKKTFFPKPPRHDPLIKHPRGYESLDTYPMSATDALPEFLCFP